MLAFPNSKINIGLHITGRRADGYHNLETVFYPIAIKDALEIIVSEQQEKDILFTSSGLLVPGNDENNLCVRAYRLLKQDFPAIPSIRMHLHKTIPMGAGLGGGSADAACALDVINNKFNLQLSTGDLVSYASRLGSDCAFFIINRPCYGTGRGELLQQINLDLSAYRFVIVHPGIHVNTAEAFKQIRPGLENNHLEQKVLSPVNEWRTQISNDFENVVFYSYPEIARIKTMLYQAGALYASMSGSGSAVYGIFEGQPAESLNFPAHYFYRWI